MIRPLLAIVVVVASCRAPAPAPPAVVEVPVPTLPVEPPWVGTLAAVQTAVDSGRFELADTILVEFERTEAGARDVSESAFWRALLRADPRNPAFTPATARATLEAYLATSPDQRRTEVEILLRHLTIADSLRAAQSVQRSAVELRDRTRDEELQKLREELQRTQAELDRIKRRLGSPKP